MIDALQELQRTGTKDDPGPWSDGKMAHRLGYSRTAWNLMRRGKYPHSYQRMAAKAIVAFPEIIAQALLFLQSAR